MLALQYTATVSGVFHIECLLLVSARAIALGQRSSREAQLYLFADERPAAAGDTIEYVSRVYSFEFEAHSRSVWL